LRRREFIGGFGAATAWAIAARAQQGKKRVAIISPARPVETIKTHPYFRAFQGELSRRGFVEEQNLIVDRYSGRGQMGSYDDLARAVVASTTVSQVPPLFTR
jgi:putative tryptophan/tyrosine transport system substrate-binding protein